MFTMYDLFPTHEGAKIKILDQIFTLHKTEEMSGELATWGNGDIVIYATPYFDGIPIPVDILNIDGKSSYTTVSTFEEYANVVKSISEDLLKINIYWYAFNTIRELKNDELKELSESYTEENFKLDYDYQRDKGIDYLTFMNIVKTMIFIKDNYERYTVFDTKSFLEAYSFFGVV